MSFSNIIDIVVENIGMSFDWLVLLIFIVASLMFFAKSFQLGLVILLTTSGAIFVWFYQESLNWNLPFAIFMISLVALLLSLFAVENTSTTGGIA